MSLAPLDSESISMTKCSNDENHNHMWFFENLNNKSKGLPHV